MSQHDEVGDAGRAHLGTVLVVEDEFLIGMDLVMTLTGAGYEVLGPAGRAVDALALLKDHEPDAAILDVNLGDHRVTPVAQELASRNIPYVLASAYSGLDIRNEPLFANTVNLGKPTRPEPLLSAVSRMIMERRK